MLVDLAPEHRALPSALPQVTEITASGSRLAYGDGRGGVKVGDDKIRGSVAAVERNLKVERRPSLGSLTSVRMCCKESTELAAERGLVYRSGESEVRPASWSERDSPGESSALVYVPQPNEIQAGAGRPTKYRSEVLRSCGMEIQSGCGAPFGVSTSLFPRCGDVGIPSRAPRSSSAPLVSLATWEQADTMKASDRAPSP